MLRLNLKAGSLAMSYLINEEKVRNLAEKYVSDPQQELIYVPDGIKISCCGFKLREYESVDKFIEDMANYVEAARNSGAQILVFPQLIGECSLFFMPGYKKIINELKLAISQGHEEEARAFKNLVSATEGFIREIFLNTFSTLAKSYKMILVGGGLYTISHDNIYNTIYCFDENGSIAGTQDKIFLSPLEKRWGVSEGEKLTPARTTLGSIALLFSDGSRNYEPYYIARAMGCQLATVSASPFSCDTSCLAFRAHETGMAIASSGIFSKDSDKGINIWDFPKIAVPSALTPDESGILKTGSESVITARIDLIKLSHCFDVYTADMNLDYIKWLMEISQ